MNAALVATKLYIPTVRHNLMPRPRLTARLNECMAYPLALISAPAGYGKTSLTSEWCAGVGRSIPMSRLSLDADDNDPARFLTYLMGALDIPRPGQCQAALALLQSPQPPPVKVCTHCWLPGQTSRWWVRHKPIATSEGA